MVLQFILTNVLLLSAGAILIIMVRALPRISEEESRAKASLLERWIASELPEKIDLALNNFLVKFLRKSKVWILKIDNLLAKHLKNIKTENGNGKPKPDFKEIMGERVGEDEVAQEGDLLNTQ
jgi:hypothetical protein